MRSLVLLVALAPIFSLTACGGYGAQSMVPSNAVAPVFQTFTDAATSNYKLYVTNTASSNVFTYGSNGKQINPTLSSGLDYPAGVAVDKHGKIYVTSFDGNTLTTYTSAGKKTTPSITTGLNGPIGVTVDSSGKIYVVNLKGGKAGLGFVATYTPSGKPTTPTIQAGIDGPWGIVVDKKG
jgi:sugar lactone lactonase YvrE